MAKLVQNAASPGTLTVPGMVHHAHAIFPLQRGKMDIKGEITCFLADLSTPPFCANRDLEYKHDS